MLVDAGVPTYMLSYFTRDRRRGPRMPLEFAVHKLTQDSASVYGLKDRGVIAPGCQADFDLSNYNGLRLAPPEMSCDLPAGSKRLVQKTQGYRVTINSGRGDVRGWGRDGGDAREADSGGEGWAGTEMAPRMNIDPRSAAACLPRTF